VLTGDVYMLKVTFF